MLLFDVFPSDILFNKMHNAYNEDFYTFPLSNIITRQAIIKQESGLYVVVILVCEFSLAAFAIWAQNVFNQDFGAQRNVGAAAEATWLFFPRFFEGIRVWEDGCGL